MLPETKQRVQEAQTARNSLKIKQAELEKAYEEVINSFLRLVLKILLRDFQHRYCSLLPVLFMRVSKRFRPELACSLSKTGAYHCTTTYFIDLNNSHLFSHLSFCGNLKICHFSTTGCL